MGNVISPQDVVGKRGAEVLRLWISMVDYLDDMRLSDEILERNVEAYRKIRNTFRYILGNINDFAPDRDAVAEDDMPGLDRWAMLKLDDLTRRVVSAYGAYQFHTVHHALHNFCAVTMSSLYFDVLKDRLYTSVPGSRARRAAQTALYRIGHAVCRLMAPLLPFTSEEVWSQLPRAAGDPDSVHLTLFPDAPAEESEDRARLRGEWERLLDLREKVTPALEEQRRAGIIGGALEAAVTLRAGPGLLELLKRHEKDLPALFIVSGVTVEPASGAAEGDSLDVSVDKAPGSKCARCWNILESVGSEPGMENLCARCVAAVTEIRKGER